MGTHHDIQRTLWCKYYNIEVINDQVLLLSVEDNGVVEWEPTMIFSVQCDVITCLRSLDTFMRTEHGYDLCPGYTF